MDPEQRTERNLAVQNSVRRKMWLFIINKVFRKETLF